MKIVNLNYKNLYFVMFMLMNVTFTFFIIFLVSINYVNLQKVENKIVSSLEIEHKQKLTENFYHHFETFLSYIYKNETFSAYLHEAKESNAVLELFKSMAGSDNEIMQLRYINEQGKEVIRVSRQKLGGDISVVKKQDLQDKKHRYYFINTMKKREGEVNISNLDLNIEKNKIAEPHTAVLRFSISVFSDGKPKGILILNVFAERLLNKILYSTGFDVDLYDQDNHILISSLNQNWTRYLGDSGLSLNTEDFVASQSLIQSPSGETLFIGLTPKPDNNVFLYFNSSMLFLIALMVLLSIFAANYLSKLPERLIRKLAIKDETIDNNILLSRTDKQGTITYVSEAFCKHSGYSKEELIGKNHNIFKHKLTSYKTFEHLWKTIRNKETWHSELQVILKDNRERWMDIKIMPEYDADRTFIGYMSIRQDITDFKKNMKRLEENADFLELERDSLTTENEMLLDNEQDMKSALNDFKDFFDTVPTPYMVVTLDLNIKDWNKTAEATFKLGSLPQIEIRPLTLLTENLSYVDFINYLNDKKYNYTTYEMCMKTQNGKANFKVHTSKLQSKKDSFILAFHAV